MATSGYRCEDGPEPSSPLEYALDQPFDADSLVALRAAVAAHGDCWGLSRQQITDLVLIAHELASNAVRHGGGVGRLRLAMVDGSVVCEVADSGPGFAFRDAVEHPPLGS